VCGQIGWDLILYDGYIRICKEDVTYFKTAYYPGIIPGVLWKTNKIPTNSR